MTFMPTRAISLWIASLCFITSTHAQVNIDYTQTSVSGLSSGGYMATQFQFAFADTVVGAGIVAAGPYYCARNSIQTALGECVTITSDATTAEPLLAYMQEQQARGNLGQPEQIAQHQVLVIHGNLDSTVNRKAANILVEQYESLLDTDIKYINDKDLAHLFPTKSNGVSCEQSESPFIGACDFDAAGEILNHIYPLLNQPLPVNPKNIVQISQAGAFSIEGAHLAEEGFAYVPSKCQNGESCKLHISFHGCNQSAADVGRAYVEKTGFNTWAEANNIIVLYPQAKKSLFAPINPQGCWDWWGYTGEQYATNKGKQIQAVKKLATTLSKQLGG